ncbi:retrovirus-related pol polyprotein from transposon TNT 1-94 [Tanacetum coccineum]
MKEIDVELCRVCISSSESWLSNQTSVNYRVLGEDYKKTRILEVKQRYFEYYCSDNQYAVSIKEDMAYLCLYTPKTTKETRSIHRLRKKSCLSLKNDMPPRDKQCMTRSSTNELFTPFQEPEREFRSSRRHFKTLSLDELRSPDFSLFSGHEEYSEEEVAETMAETMEKLFYSIMGWKFQHDRFLIQEVQYRLRLLLMRKWPSKRWQNTLKNVTMEHLGQEVLKLLTDWQLYKHNSINLGREIKKVNEKVYAAQVGCEQCKGTHYTKDFPHKEEGKTLEKAYYTKEKDLGSFTLPCFINNVCFDNTIVDLGDSGSVMPLSTYLNLGLCELAHTKLTVELADMTVKYPKGIDENVLVGIGKFVFPIDFIILDMPEDIKVPLILGRPFLSTTHAKIDVFKRKITLRVGEERIIFESVKPAISLIKRVYMLSLRERMEQARLMGETLVLNRSLDPLNGD